MTDIQITPNHSYVKPRGFYVYLHRRATDGSVFYVGKGKSDRGFSKNGRNIHWKRCARKNGVIVEVYRDNMSEPCSLTLEMILIANYGIDNLCNQVNGGGGISGWKHSQETKDRIKDYLVNREPHPNSIKALIESRPIKFTDEHKANLSKSAKKRIRHPLSQEAKDKISKAHIGMRPSKETLEKMRTSHLGQRKRHENNHFDPVIRIFRHKDHGEFIGVQYDFRFKFNMGASCLTHLIQGKRLSVKGWTYHGEHDTKI